MEPSPVSFLSRPNRAPPSRQVTAIVEGLGEAVEATYRTRLAGAAACDQRRAREARGACPPRRGTTAIANTGRAAWGAAPARA